MINRISFKDAFRKTGYRSLNGFRKWLKKKNLQVIYDDGCRKGYFIEAEFNLALEEESKIYLKTKYRYSIEELSSVINFESKLLIALFDNKKEGYLSKASGSKYYPKQKHELKFLSRLTNTLNKTNNTK